MLTKLRRFKLTILFMLLTGCIGAGSYFESPPLPVLNEPPARDYRQLGTTSTLIDMRVGNATWRSIVNYRLASQARQKYGSDANAVIMLSYNESPRHATGIAMAISYTPGPGMISASAPTQSAEQQSTPIGAKKVEKTAKSQTLAVDDNLRDVVLYREKRVVNSGASYQVSWQGNRLGTLRNGSALLVRLPPGAQTLTIGYVTNKPYKFEQAISVADQGATYVNFRMKFSFSDNPRTHMTIENVSTSEGQAAMAALW